MNKPHHHFQNRSSDVNCLPQYDYEPNAQDGLKMHAEQFSNYDNNQYSMNQPSFSYNHAMIEQDSGYHESGLRILQDHQQGVYHGYTPTDPDHYAQPSPSNYSPISQNISPIAFSSDNRQFYQDQVMGAIPINPPLPHNPLNSNKDEMPIIPSNDSSFSDLTLQNKPLDSMPSDAEKSVNGILEMEGSVEPNGPILGNHGYIPAQTMQKAYYELGETPEIKAACIRGLRQQIDIHQEENNFDEHSDAFLLKFLRSRKFDVEAAYALLERYYNVRENKPEVFRNLTRKNVKRTMEQGIVGVLPQRDKKGRVIMTFNFSKWNMSLPFHFEKLLRVFVYTLEKLFESEETQINGVVVICNLSQLSVLQTKSLGVTMIEKSVEIFQVIELSTFNCVNAINTNPITQIP